MPDASSTLEPLFKAWGVTFDPTKVIGDSTYALQTQRNVGGRPVVTQNLPWLALRTDALAKDEAILAQLSAIVMTDAGSFGTAKDGITLRPLMTASDNAVLIDAARRRRPHRRSAPHALRAQARRQAAGAGRAALRHARQRLSRRTAGRQGHARRRAPTDAAPKGGDAQALDQAASTSSWSATPTC